MTSPLIPINYNPKELPRELKKYYISATPEEIEEMLKDVGASSRQELFAHIPQEFSAKVPKICKRLDYQELLVHLNELANKNQLKSSFIGDGLKWYAVHPIVEFVSQIRGLTTAYTPYQPERSQGTLRSLWIYSSALARLTGFEAINSSFYDRSTAIFEAISTAIKINKGKKTVLISEGLYPEDLKVVKTMIEGTSVRLESFPLSAKTGLTDEAYLKERIDKQSADLAAVIYPQCNSLGFLESVHHITDTIQAHKALAIAIVDPMLLGGGGLVPPSRFGTKGADMIVGEGQHLAIDTNFGGPGLGVFGIRFNSKEKTAIRSTAGRFVGKARDLGGQECLSMVLSTREQHIRREKASSNICSNQSFLATLAGAALLGRGEEGLAYTLKTARDKALDIARFVGGLKGIKLAFDSPFFNEICLECPADRPPALLLERAGKQNLHLGVDVSDRLPSDKKLLLLFFNDRQNPEDLEKLKSFLLEEFGENSQSTFSSPLFLPLYLEKMQWGWEILPLMISKNFIRSWESKMSAPMTMSIR